MKAAAPSIPIVILTASCDLNDKVILLEMGADDYLTKPFSPRELVARTRDTTPKAGPATPVVSAVNVRVSRDCF